VLEVLHAHLELVEHDQAGAAQQVPFGPRVRVVVALGQRQQLLADERGLVELGPVQVQAPQRPQGRERVGDAACGFTQVQGPPG
jgi:hypothetical protein